MFIKAEDGYISIPAVELEVFLAALKRHRRTLEELHHLTEDAKRLAQGRFVAEIISTGTKIEDRLSVGQVYLLPNGSVREVISQVRHTYRELKRYIEPCFGRARSIERIGYEEHVAASQRDGFTTVHAHGVARLTDGRVEYRAIGKIVKVYPSADPSRFTLESA